MITIKCPATSANLGPGFDCLGLSYNLYNTFEVERSNEDILENVDDRFNNSDNLFLQSYHYACQQLGIEDYVHAIFHCDIPVSRGLGSSAAMIVGGITAASVLHDDALSDSQIFQLASILEGHPDNAAPCVFGGLTASMKYQNQFISRKLELHPDWFYTLFIPDFEVSTEEARGILPEAYPRDVVSLNSACALYVVDGLRTGSLQALQLGNRDAIHEPYRKTLIDGYDALKQYVEKQSHGAFMISGSGSTCLFISKSPVPSTIHSFIKENLNHHWDVLQLQPSYGIEIKGE